MQEASNVYNHQKNHPVGKSLSSKLLSLEKYNTEKKRIRHGLICHS